MPDPEIRLPTEQEVDEWLRLRAALWPDLPPDAHESETAELLLDDGRSTVLVAPSAGSTLAGFVEVSLRDWAEGCLCSPVGYLEGWFVDEAHRGRGVGRALVAAAEAWAHDLGCREMASDTEVENAASSEAHRKMGYGRTATLIHYRKDLPGGEHIG